MKKTIAFLLGVATIIGTSMSALAADQKTGEPILISTNVSKAAEKKMGESILISANKSKSTINNNLIIAGKSVNIGNLRVAINNGNVMVPLKITAESLGFKVSADADNKIITLDNDKIKTRIEVGLDLYYYESSHAIGLTAPQSFGAAPMVIDNVVYVHD